MTLRVLEPGLCSLIVDQGRPHCRSLGVPVGGAADRSALAIGNALLGNLSDAAALEIAMVGPALLAVRRIGAVIVGAPFQIGSNRQSLCVNKSFTLEPDEVLHVGGTPHGARAYLCVVGGFQMPWILQSRSALAPIAAGDELVCDESAIRGHFIRADLSQALVPCLAPEFCSASHRLRVVAGAQADWFSWTLDRTDPWTVSAAGNRMGLRLTGPALEVPPRELVSEPVCPGSIQITQAGQPIILGVDGQTIGGYPKVAQVIAADLDLVGQLRQGDEITFEAVTLERAESLYRARAQGLRRLTERIRLAVGAF